MTAHASVLSGVLVELEPLTAQHVPALMAIARQSPEAFRLTSTPITDEERDAYFGEAFRNMANGLAIPFAIVRKDSRSIVGTTRVNELDIHNRRCSIGFTWISPTHHGDGTNLEAKFLLLELAFERLEVNRVQFQVDERNEKSRRAVERLGATQEGRLRLHMLAKDGSFRNTIIYSIVVTEWPTLKEELRQRIRSRLNATQARFA